MSIYFDSGEGASHRSQFRSKALHSQTKVQKAEQSNDKLELGLEARSESLNNAAKAREAELIFHANEARILGQEDQIIKEEDERRKKEDSIRKEEDEMRYKDVLY